MKLPAVLFAVSLTVAVVQQPVQAGDDADSLPKFEDVAKGYDVVQPAPGQRGFYVLHRRAKDAQLLAELPADYDGKRFYMIATVAQGHPEAGVYSIWHSGVGVPATVMAWEKRGDKLALVEPNLAYISSGDAQSRSALERIYTGRVLLSTAILCTGPGGGPVIDLDQVLLGSASRFFGGFTAGADTSLARISTAKVFPENIEIGFELPRASGRLVEIRYSIGMPAREPGYEPREADRRVGIYYSDYTDRARHDGESQTVRYANRWRLEKADPSLRLSPPKRPIVYHIEHTTPIRYRRWVREGILAWNKAFEQVGIVDAIVVLQQDARSGAYMDRDPEDIRWSFVRWTNSEMGFAIGPVHFHPDTGEIYEADIVMDEGFISSYVAQHLETELAAAAMSALHPELAPWLAGNPSWDPRSRLASPRDRPAVAALARAMVSGAANAVDPGDQGDQGAWELPDGGLPPTMLPQVWSPHAASAAADRNSCRVQPGLAASVASVRLAVDLGLIGPLAPLGDLDTGDDAGDDDEQAESMLDGLPESFIGPMLRDVVMHEVGHTMGLMHNWKGSAQFGFAEINSAEFKGVRPLLGTVMDYAPANLVVAGGELVQGDYASIDIGPYDMWAIEWNYTDGDPQAVAGRAAEPGLGFMAEDGQFSPDPQAKAWDLGANSIDHAEAVIVFVEHARARFLDQAIDDGESWQKARRLFGMLLGKQLGAIAEASHWVGGAHITRFLKGDLEDADPVTPVAVAQQRRALAFIVREAFREDAFGLDPALMRKLGSDNWYDDGFADDHDWAIHDSVLGIQAAALTMLMNPTRLRRVQDNERRVDSADDALTVPELLAAVREAIWSPLAATGGEFSNRKPLISSIERNCQGEHLSRLIDLATGMSWPGAAAHDLATLARQELRAVDAAVQGALGRAGLDAYSLAHLADASERIRRALEAGYLRNG